MSNPFNQSDASTVSDQPNNHLLNFIPNFNDFPQLSSNNEAPPNIMNGNIMDIGQGGNIYPAGELSGTAQNTHIQAAADGTAASGISAGADYSNANIDSTLQSLASDAASANSASAGSGSESNPMQTIEQELSQILSLLEGGSSSGGGTTSGDSGISSGSGTAAGGAGVSSEVPAAGGAGVSSEVPATSGAGVSSEVPAAGGSGGSSENPGMQTTGNLQTDALNVINDLSGPERASFDTNSVLGDNDLSTVEQLLQVGGDGSGNSNAVADLVNGINSTILPADQQSTQNLWNALPEEGGALADFGDASYALNEALADYQTSGSTATGAGALQGVLQDAGNYQTQLDAQQDQEMETDKAAEGAYYVGPPIFGAPNFPNSDINGVIQGSPNGPMQPNADEAGTENSPYFYTPPASS